jgi:hypothetical protein
MNAIDAKPPVSDVIIVKQRAAVFVAFLLAGVSFCVAARFILNGIPLWGRCFFTLMGALAIAAGVLGWRAARIGLVVDRHGIWCGFRRRKTLVPWEAILRARKVVCPAPDGDDEGILLDLREGAEYPGGDAYGSMMKAHLERVLNDQTLERPLLLCHTEWIWNLDDVLQQIVERVEHPESRNSLGEYRNV